MRALRAAGRGEEASALTEALSEAAVDPNASWGVIKVWRLPKTQVAADSALLLPTARPEHVIPDLKHGAHHLH